MSDQERYLANPAVSFGDEGEDGAVLFNPDTDDVMIVNTTGKSIWEYIDTPRTREQIVDHLQAAFRNCPPEQAARDVEQFIQDLLPDFIHCQ